MTLLHPLHTRVLVKRLDKERKTESGILLPEDFTGQDEFGTVIEVGPQVADVKVGDGIMFGKFAGQEIKVDGVTLVVMKEDEIFAVVEE